LSRNLGTLTSWNPLGLSRPVNGTDLPLIKMKELETTIKALKARKSPGSDWINNELYKYAPKSFYINV